MQTEIIHFFVISIGFVFFAYFLQSTIVASADVSYLIHASLQLFHGGRYGLDIFETNPPMILYLYFPVHLLMNLFSLDVVFALSIYVSCLSLFSFFGCLWLQNKVTPGDRFYRYSMGFILLWTLFPLPLIAYGQREHLMMILTLPYMFLMILVLQNKHLKPWVRFLIGMFAGLGFSIKPFFVIPFVFIEIYGCIKKRSFKALFRIESLTIVSIILLYVTSIVIWQPEYFTIILPYVFKYYFPFYTRSFEIIFLQPEVIFCAATLVTYCVFYPSDRYQTVGVILWLMFLGMMIAFLIPKQMWRYHFYPAVALSYLLNMHCLVQLCIGKNIPRKILSLSLFSGLVFFVPLCQYNHVLKETQTLTKNYPLRPVEAFINRQGERSIYCFSLYTSDCFPLIYQTKMRYAERFSSFWWFKGIIKSEKENNPNLKAMIEKDKEILIGNIADDLNNLKARWVIFNEYVFRMVDLKFDLIDYFSKNEKFREAWKNYRDQGKVGEYRVYERIHERIPDKQKSVFRDNPV